MTELLPARKRFSMQSPDEWFARAELKGLLARTVCDDRKLAFEAVDACGWACEFALKGVIMRRDRMNRWPDKSERPDLYVHNLWKLMAMAGIERSSLPPHLRGKVKVAFSLNVVEQRYQSNRVPRKIARAMTDDVFGDDGVLRWLKTL